MIEEGKTQRKVAEHFGLGNKEVVKGLLKRARQKERKLAAGLEVRSKGRPRKDAVPRSVEVEQAYEISRLKKENDMFLCLFKSVLY